MLQESSNSLVRSITTTGFKPGALYLYVRRHETDAPVKDQTAQAVEPSYPRFNPAFRAVLRQRIIKAEHKQPRSQYRHALPKHSTSSEHCTQQLPSCHSAKMGPKLDAGRPLSPLAYCPLSNPRSPTTASQWLHKTGRAGRVPRRRSLSLPPGPHVTTSSVERGGIREGCRLVTVPLYELTSPNPYGSCILSPLSLFTGIPYTALEIYFAGKLRARKDHSNGTEPRLPSGQMLAAVTRPSFRSATKVSYLSGFCAAGCLRPCYLDMTLTGPYPGGL